MLINDGGPAFPEQMVWDDREGTVLYGSQNVAHAGMSLRDYFAAKALPIVIANQYPLPDQASKEAYEYADAMLKARSQE